MATDGLNNLVQIQPARAAQAETPAISLEAAREKLSNARGPKYWRTLEELAGDPAFAETLQREFPRQTSEWTDGVSRRNFLKLSAASLALAGLSGCTKQPYEDIVPYVQQPEELIPGKPIYFSTARPSLMGAAPLLVKTNEYRPTKVEGNPDHPMTMSLAQDVAVKSSRWGISDNISQASVLDLYDPDRSQSVLRQGAYHTFGDLVGEMRDAATAMHANGGAGLRLLTETVTSPSMVAQIQALLKLYPNAKWYQYDAVNRDNARAGARMAFGQYLEPQFDLTKADVIVSLDADFLSGPTFPGFHKLARDFSTRRKLNAGQREMSRFYVVESTITATGAKADSRLGIPAWQVEQFAGALAQRLGAGGGGKVADAKSSKFLDAVVKDLQAARGKCVVIAGEQQSPAVHAMAAAINSALGNSGKTVVYGEPVEVVPTEQVPALKELVADMRSGKVSLLVMLGGNPVYDAPSDLNFANALSKVPTTVHLASYVDETSSLCTWHVPMAHYMEAWGDTRAYDGTITIVQPIIEPLYNGHSPYEVLGIFSESGGAKSYDVVRNYWQAQSKGDFDKFWRDTLFYGFVSGTPSTGKSVSARPAPAAAAAPSGDTIEIVFRPDPNIFDGRYNNNGWLQELPKPITKLTWDNAVLMSQTTAKKLNVASQQVVQLELAGRKVSGPVFIVPGHPDNTVTVHLGYGRNAVGRVGMGSGFSGYVLRTTTNWNGATGVKITPTGDKHSLAITQHQFLIGVPGDATGFLNNIHNKELGHLPGQSETGEEAKKRDLIRSATLEEFKQDPNFAKDAQDYPDPHAMTLFGENGYMSWTEDPAKISTSATGVGHQWGMAIDMNSCVGCNACVVACVAENNIAVVGKEQVLAGRHMYWLRIDTYFETPNTGDLANPRAYFQPIPCMQCENAPCEPVCPVGATVHSTEGLNNMVYNRCVGTRYCSNNCPYKVRRFNFLLFSDFETEQLYGLRNPDVTVRSRGVMEKCTYCVQRITAGRIAAEKEDRKVRDGEVATACQQSCPTDAIVFGDINDPNSRVNRLKRNERNYALLAELNTKPRTTYLAEVRNPSTLLEPATENHGNG